MRSANLISATILILFSILMLWIVIPTQIEQGPKGMMSPRLLPQMMMWLILGLSVLLILTNLRKPHGGTSAPSDTPLADYSAPPISRNEISALLKIGAVMILALVLFLTTGPLLSGVAVITGGLAVLGERRPIVFIVMPLVLVGGTYLLFYRLLGTAIV